MNAQFEVKLEATRSPSMFDAHVGFKVVPYSPDSCLHTSLYFLLQMRACSPISLEIVVVFSWRGRRHGRPITIAGVVFPDAKPALVVAAVSVIVVIFDVVIAAVDRPGPAAVATEDGRLEAIAYVIRSFGAKRISLGLRWIDILNESRKFRVAIFVFLQIASCH